MHENDRKNFKKSIIIWPLRCWNSSRICFHKIMEPVCEGRMKITVIKFKKFFTKYGLRTTLLRTSNLIRKQRGKPENWKIVYPYSSYQANRKSKNNNNFITCIVDLPISRDKKMRYVKLERQEGAKTPVSSAISCVLIYYRWVISWILFFCFNRP